MPIRDVEERRAYQREWVARRRNAWFADKTCASCGGDERLDLHHVDPTKKVGHAIWSWSETRRREEIAKCVVLCRPCHERGHAEARRIEAELTNPCGTYAAYKRGCSCDACREANNVYQAQRRPVPDSNRRTRLCRPLPNHSVNWPGHYEINPNTPPGETRHYQDVCGVRPPLRPRTGVPILSTDCPPFYLEVRDA